MPLSFFQKRQKEKAASIFFLANGSSLLEELISSFGGRYKNPIRHFTAKELIIATNNCAERIVISAEVDMYQGSLKGQQILVRAWKCREGRPSISERFIRDVAVSSQMSHLKNVLKFKGCCLEFKFPALVYECAGTELLSVLLHHPGNEKLFSWHKRLQIAKGIAYAIAYLHTAFPTPIIHRDLKPPTVFIDKDCIPKLFDFSISIRLPPGESQVEDTLVGTCGYLDPEYVISEIVTEKTDVYSFGVLLLMLLTGKESMPKKHEKIISLRDFVKYHIEKDQFNDILDSNIREDEKERHRKQLLAFMNLAMNCTDERGEDRPNMVQVCKELCKMEKCA